MAAGGALARRGRALCSRIGPPGLPGAAVPPSHQSKSQRQTAPAVHSQGRPSTARQLTARAPPPSGSVVGGGDVRVNAKNNLGRCGEQAAVEYLERAGLRILDRNWRCTEGEIDIVAAERQVLVICEVKTRSSAQYGSPFEAITRSKRARLRRLAVRWLVAHGVLFDEVRIDVIGLVRDKSGHYQREHVRGVGYVPVARTH